MQAKLYKNFLLKIVANIIAQHEIAHHGRGSNIDKTFVKLKSVAFAKFTTLLEISNIKIRIVKNHKSTLFAFLLLFLKQYVMHIIKTIHPINVKICPNPQGCAGEGSGAFVNNQSLKLIFTIISKKYKYRNINYCFRHLLSYLKQTIKIKLN